MPDPLAAQRAYEDIKQRLFEGRFGLADRLDVLRLAKALRLSATPVREALARLAFERLVRVEPKRGYFARLWNEEELRALYEWRGALSVMALASPFTVELSPDAQTYATRARNLFSVLSSGANPELRIAAALADDRLEWARRVEPDVLRDADDELARLAELAVQRSRTLGRALRLYHARRMRFVEDIRAAAVLRAVGNNGA
jgi:hypothetical protein